jgi:hypothetical protein
VDIVFEDSINGYFTPKMIGTIFTYVCIGSTITFTFKQQDGTNVIVNYSYSPTRISLLETVYDKRTSCPVNSGTTSGVPPAGGSPGTTTPPAGGSPGTTTPPSFTFIGKDFTTSLPFYLGIWNTLTFTTTGLARFSNSISNDWTARGYTFNQATLTVQITADPNDPIDNLSGTGTFTTPNTFSFRGKNWVSS